MARQGDAGSLRVSELCQIVYLVDHRGGPTERHGFAYGTLPEQTERGEALRGGMGSRIGFGLI